MLKLIKNWVSKRHKCELCGTDKSVKYIHEEMYICNKCILGIESRNNSSVNSRNNLGGSSDNWFTSEQRKMMIPDNKVVTTFKHNGEQNIMPGDLVHLNDDGTVELATHRGKVIGVVDGVQIQDYEFALTVNVCTNPSIPHDALQKYFMNIDKVEARKKRYRSKLNLKEILDGE